MRNKRLGELLTKIDKQVNLKQDVDLEDMKDLHLEIASDENISPAMTELNMLFYTFYNRLQSDENKQSNEK